MAIVNPNNYLPGLDIREIIETVSSGSVGAGSSAEVTINHDEVFLTNPFPIVTHDGADQNNVTAEVIRCDNKSVVVKVTNNTEEAVTVNVTIKRVGI